MTDLQQLVKVLQNLDAPAQRELMAVLGRDVFISCGIEDLDEFAGHLSHDTLNLMHNAVITEVELRRQDAKAGKNNYPY